MAHFRPFIPAVYMAAAVAFAAPAFAIDLGGTLGQLTGGGAPVSAPAGAPINGGSLGGPSVNEPLSLAGPGLPSAGALTANGGGAPVPPASSAAYATALQQASALEPIDGVLTQAGLPPSGALPLAAGVIVGGAAGALASPTPVESTVKYVEFRATSALELVGNAAGGAVPPN